MDTPTTADFPWLTVLILVPLVAALVLWLIKPLHRHSRVYGLIVSSLTSRTLASLS